MKTKITIISFFALTLVLGLHGAVLADDTCPPGMVATPDEVNGGTICNAVPGLDGYVVIGAPNDSSMWGDTAESALERLIEDIVDFIFWAGLIICPLIVVIGGFMYMTAGGNFSRATSAKKLILWAVIGLAIAVAAKFIIGILKYILDY